MKKISSLVNDFLQKNLIEKLANIKSIDINEAKKQISSMSFKEYNSLIEQTIVPPSGQTISPNITSKGTDTTNPQDSKPLWPGKGAPVQVGMTVGLKDQAGRSMPGVVSQVDNSAKGVKIKNPTTGKDEWMNLDTLEPFMNDPNQQMKENFSNTYNLDDRVETPLGSGTIVKISPDIDVSGKVMVRLDDPSLAGEDGKYKDTFMFTTDTLSRLAVNSDLQRLQELAGIKESCSAGATGAGAIAVAPASMGKIKKRQSTEEQAPPVEYKPKGPPKTIVGDTKPAQASGELSSNLAARGKKTASRTNNGFKK